MEGGDEFKPMALPMRRVDRSVLAAALGAAVLLAGCVPAAVVMDRYGNAITPLNDLNWGDWQSAIDLAIEREHAGKAPPGRIASWESFWLARLSYLETRGRQGVPLTEHHELYVRYLIQHRKAVGLPDLPGYPSA
jgi:hypothetical protein